MATKFPKPKRGECGTCHWFEVWPHHNQNPDSPLGGSCVVSPPHPYQQMQPIKGTQLSQQGTQFTTVAAGMVPPTHELRRCSLWRPCGANPPYDDTMKFGPIKPANDNEEDHSEAKQ